ncbi:MAG: hypothetical protein QG622_3552 [Actinomycetota bacterium]|nr:hypothetical protein [Actinomycetota bacterium]
MDGHEHRLPVSGYPETPEAWAALPSEKTYLGKAVPSGGGWEIRIFQAGSPDPSETTTFGITRCRTIAQIEGAVRSYVEAVTGETDVIVIASPDVGDDLMLRVIQAWKAMKEVKAAEVEAAAQVREVVRELRARGLSTTDIAFIAHVSRGRVSQLLR